MIKRLPPLPDDEEYVSYDIVSLFTNGPLDETIDYIIEINYTHNKPPQIFSKLIFCWLFEKKTKDCAFQLCFKFYKQVDGCTIDRPLLVILSDIYMAKMENDIVEKHQPKFYKHYVDDINCHKKIRSKPQRFLDTNLEVQNGTVITSVNCKETKLPLTPWESKIPKKYKCKVIIGDLHRSKRITTDFTEENVIKNKLKSRFSD